MLRGPDTDECLGRKALTGTYWAYNSQASVESIDSIVVVLITNNQHIENIYPQGRHHDNGQKKVYNESHAKGTVESEVLVCGRREDQF